jgi:hypothetical protein
VFLGTGPQTPGTVVFNPKNGDVYTTADFGNVPDGLCGSAIVAGDHVLAVEGAPKKGKVTAGLYSPVLPSAIRPTGPKWDDEAAVSDAPVLRRMRSQKIDPVVRKSLIVRGQVVFEDDAYDDEDEIPVSGQLETSASVSGYLPGLIPPSAINLRLPSHLVVSILFVVVVVGVMLFVASRIK